MEFLLNNKNINLNDFLQHMNNMKEDNENCFACAADLFGMDFTWLYFLKSKLCNVATKSSYTEYNHMLYSYDISIL